MYELEFKLNLINNHKDKFDPEDNITDVKLEEVKRVLDDSVRVIGLHLLSLVYQIIQNWLNYHNVNRFIPNIFTIGNRAYRGNQKHRFIRNFVRIMGFEDILLTYPKTDNISNKYNIKLLSDILSGVFESPNKHKDILNVLEDFTIGQSTENENPDLFKFTEQCFEITKRYYDEYSYKYPNISNDLEKVFRVFKYFLPDITSIFTGYSAFYLELKKSDQEQQSSYKYEIIKNFYIQLRKFQKEFYTWLSNTYSNKTNNLITLMSNTLDRLYLILLNINTISQRQILTEQNIAINIVHHRQSFVETLNDISIGMWQQSDVYKYYPYDVRNIIPPNIIDQIYTNNALYFDANEQIYPSISRISTLFTDKRQASNYIEDKFFTFNNQSYGNLNAERFLTLLSKLPKPEMRYWAQELMKFGLDRHIHLLMDIDGSRIKYDK